MVLNVLNSNMSMVKINRTNITLVPKIKNPTKITDFRPIRYELMNYLEHKKDGREGVVAIKLYMSKAYDRVEWSFIKQVMEKMGFHEKWIELIMHCITSVSYSILVNGVAYGSITLSKGLRQGDPISPYSFLLCANSFSSLINNAAMNQRISRVSICRGCPKITHLFFCR